MNFIWCFLLHRLGLKDSLNEFIKPLNQQFTHLHYIYKKSSKKIESQAVSPDTERELCF